MLSQAGSSGSSPAVAGSALAPSTGVMHRRVASHGSDILITGQLLFWRTLRLPPLSSTHVLAGQQPGQLTHQLTAPQQPWRHWRCWRASRRWPWRRPAAAHWGRQRAAHQSGSRGTCAVVRRVVHIRRCCAGVLPHRALQSARVLDPGVCCLGLLETPQRRQLAWRPDFDVPLAQLSMQVSA